MKFQLTFGNKIRLTFIGVVLVLALFTSIYFPMEEKKLLVRSYNEKIESLSETISLGVTIGLKNGDITATQRAFEFAKSKPGIRLIALISGNEIVVSYPQGITSVDEFLKADSLVAGMSMVKTDSFDGKIIVAGSKGEINSSVAEARFAAIVFSLLFLLVGLIIAVLFSKSMARPITQLNVAAKEVSEGNLNVSLVVKSKDEIGCLAVSFNHMIEKIKETLNDLAKEKNSVETKVEDAVKESEKQKEYLTESVDKMVHEMNKFSDGDLTVRLTAEKDDEIGKLYNGFNNAVQNIKDMIIATSEAVKATANASNEISSSTEEMASGSQELSSQTTEVASAVEQMASTILQTTKNASSAAEFSQRAAQSAINGGQVVKQTVEGMNCIAQVVGNAASIVKELGKSSNQIGEIIQVIDDIADQTNLLALNAAIEAARAGEQGRGFAVVADEVRKLAERTTKATKEIATMIKKIQKDTGNAVESIESGTREVETGKELAKKAISALDEIIGSTNETIDVVNQVAAASEEQSSAAEQISKSIEGISSVTHESAARIQQIAKASEDLSNLTTNLQNLVNKFQIDADATFLRRIENKNRVLNSFSEISYA